MDINNLYKKLKKEISTEDVISHFLGIFGHKFHPIDGDALEITDTEVSQAIKNSFSPVGEDHEFRQFIFQEENFRGIFDVDLIQKDIVNIRLQLFSKQPMNKRETKKRMKEINDFLESLLGRPNQKTLFSQDKMWNLIDKPYYISTQFVNHALAPSFSVYFTDKRYI